MGYIFVRVNWCGTHRSVALILFPRISDVAIFTCNYQFICLLFNSTFLSRVLSKFLSMFSLRIVILFSGFLCCYVIVKINHPKTWQNVLQIINRHHWFKDILRLSVADRFEFKLFLSQNTTAPNAAPGSLTWKKISKYMSAKVCFKLILLT